VDWAEHVFEGGMLYVQVRFTKIGREFGGKNHSTVLRSIQKVEARRRTDLDLNRTVEKLFDSMK
jgi:chromosomal replication initiation ATPase DnaA